MYVFESQHGVVKGHTILSVTNILSNICRQNIHDKYHYTYISILKFKLQD